MLIPRNTEVVNREDRHLILTRSTKENKILRMCKISKLLPERGKMEENI
jgi:hypothetical protein